MCPADAPFGIAPPAYRLPAATHIGRVRLQIADLQRSIDYYTAVLGLRVLAQSAAAATLGPHGSDTALLELHERRGVRPVPRRGLLGLFHFAVLLPDRESLGRFVSHVGSLGLSAGSADHAVSEALYLTDPDGLGIEVYVDRSRSTWRRNGPELYMTTEPLDLRSLVMAGGDQPWTGTPRGTVIGHVHLYVGDLGKAAAFYHLALGFDQTVWSYPGALFLSAGGYHHHLGTNTWAAGAPPATADDARLLDWELVVPSAADAAAALGSLREAGYSEDERGSGVVPDPWGTRLRIIDARV